jgi:hypothetical protein
MKSNLLLAITLLTAFLVSCTSRSDRDSDSVYQETVDIEGATRLKVNGAFNLYLYQGDLESLRIEGNEDLVKKLKVDQQGDILELSLEDEDIRLFSKDGIQVHLTLAQFRQLQFEGAGNIQTRSQFEVTDFWVNGNGVGNIELELVAENVEAQLNFVGNMVLKGSAENFDLTNEGVGNIDASQLLVQKASVNSSGIGAVSVHCEGELSLKVSGIGTVSYTGNPTIVYENISGIGKVNRN